MIILFVLIIILFLFIKSIEYFIDLNEFTYYDENGNKVNNLESEVDEQQMANEFISPNDVILELGARYGTVSVLMAKIVENKGKLVAVEVDKNIIPALEKNRKNNNANFEICDKIISNKPMKIVYDGYGTFIEQNEDDGDNSRITYEDFKKKYPYKFNVLVADCEGCIEYFLEMMGDDLKYYNKILFEEDLPDKCNYGKVKEKLTSFGFVEKKAIHNVVWRYYYEKA
jgi:FkbM family methyltransferase